MFTAIFLKELREQWRTWRLGIFCIVLAVMGLASPLLAYYTPLMLSAIPDLPPGLAESIPEPGLADAILQYVKNVSQFGLLLGVVMAMGTIAQEKERGTAAMLLVRPVKRWAVIVAKWLVWMLTILAGLLVSSVLAVIYTAILFRLPDLGTFALMNLLMAIYLAVFVSLALMASALMRSQGAAAGLSLGIVTVLVVAGAIPRIGEYLPGHLNSWGTVIAFGNQTLSAWPSLWISLGIIAVSLLLAILRFQREEI